IPHEGRKNRNTVGIQTGLPFLRLDVDIVIGVRHADPLLVELAAATYQIELDERRERDRLEKLDEIPSKVRRGFPCRWTSISRETADQEFGGIGSVEPWREHVRTFPAIEKEFLREIDRPRVALRSESAECIPPCGRVALEIRIVRRERFVIP